VTALAVVLGGAVSLEAAPLGERPVLLRGLGEDLLHPESLLRRHIVFSEGGRRRGRGRGLG